MKNNKIPRKFNRIVGKILVDTNISKTDDILHVSKEDNRYLVFNTRTEKSGVCVVSMLRDSEVFEVVSID